MPAILNITAYGTNVEEEVEDGAREAEYKLSEETREYMEYEVGVFDLKLPEKACCKYLLRRLAIVTR